MRAWYNGNTSASQAEAEGSIPFARTKCKKGSIMDIKQIAKNVMDTEIAGLTELRDHIMNDPEFERAVQLLINRRGNIVITGMGKSGHIAKKIATTMASTGSPALFIHPSEASHGDLGMVSHDNIVIAISNGGESKELSDIINYCKRYDIPIISMTRAPDSTLAKNATVSLTMPRVPECCKLGKAPTTSTTQTLAYGDVLTMILEHANHLDADMYKNWHPGGKLGASLLKITDIMHRGDDVPLVNENDVFMKIVEVMSRPTRFGCVGVIDNNGKLTGVFTDGDIRRAIGIDLMGKKADEVMKRNPITIPDTTLATEALRIINEKKIQTLFIVDNDNKPIGIISFHDLLKAGVL